MLPIGRFAKLAQVSARTLRHYEALGLITASLRGDNQYRYYDHELLDRVIRIRELQGLGFSLEEIRDVLQVPPSDWIGYLERKLVEVDREWSILDDRRQRLRTLLSVSQKIDSGESIQP